MKEVLNELFEYKSLTKERAREILVNLAKGEYNPSQMAAFLTVFMMRSITVEELEGFRDAMLDLCVALDLKKYDAIDLCGTGGDGKDTFNISTLASFVVAGAGQNVAKHGNNGVSSICGSSNLLAYFGYEFTNDKDKIEKSIAESGICFLHAPLFHPAMKNIAPIRKELGVKTFFNMLGPMVNPAFPDKQLVGVFSLELARLYGYLYQRSGKEFVILHSLDGYDEVSLTGGFKMITNQGEKVLYPGDLGLSTVKAIELKGGETIEESAAIFLKVIKGEGTRAQTEAVLANAGLALYVGKQLSSVKEGVQMAKESLESGRAFQTFRNLVGDSKISVSIS
ncbi:MULTISPECIES: anthranilate phosphoribosyltransferase [unclassified Imperialibacter]|uniref:anthranilate phosphoribosyltransferase n=1 Tax=unclassified Imperialibacter TaxID=2629706 RepID=UPI001254EA07|nr:MULTISPECIES: anthranilate phosphoribosyltransferase [unclassified Imperialibacter]CAD5248882.1 Anthranilate phosphoribosyltransferase [Imperialibacter sp. 89]CAD5263696.1 Anthranilate phosphoribosyltransferase [Imperialibacter sp. 75]VVT07551.1 Anthranilate phosphoribosyltransferase [Imperialibacter sp. EC-SDR9]